MGAAQPRAVETAAELINEAAKAALESANGDPKAATEAMELAVRSNRKLRDALTEPLIRTACYTVVSAQIRRDRVEVWKPTGPVRIERQGNSQVHRIVQLAAGTLLMFPLPGGKKLGEATRADISRAAEFYDSQAGDMAHKARWLRLIGQSLPDDKEVGAVLTDKRLRELQEVARDER